MLFGFALVRLRLRSEPHTPNNVSESLVGTKQIERGIDIQKRPRGFPFSIAAVEGFQRFLLLSQPAYTCDWSNSPTIDFLLFLQNLLRGARQDSSEEEPASRK